MSIVDVAFDRVTKRYRIPAEPNAAPVGLLARMRQKYLAAPNSFLAVQDLSFTVPRGQAMGIIGHNGAGKSTILKLLSGITAPSEGVITVRGRVAALLEVGSGFHPELTGRENVFLSGSILGMSRKEIHKKLESIIDFAEIRRFIDVPVKRYSSGMYVRLGFSIAAHLEPDVLLLDEVLAVGDAKFQEKSKQRILELKRAGTTIIFISHDLHAVQQVCDRVLVVQRGKLIHDGEPHTAIVAYEKSGRTPVETASVDRSGKRISITSVELLDTDGQPKRNIATASPLRVRISYIAHAAVSDARIFAVFHSPDWQMRCVFEAGKEFPLDLPPGPGAIEFSCDELPLQPGLYLLDPTINLGGSDEPEDWIRDCTVVQVTAGTARVEGTFYHPHTWSFASTGEERDSAAGSRYTPAGHSEV
jgi:ABC-type polysaccharide/polyol phosphate transport system ATPase subunit